MKPTKSIFFIAPMIALVLLSCRFATVEINANNVRGSGNLKTETREVSDFERVTLEYRGSLTIIQSDEEGLTIEADDNLLPLLRSEVRGRELVLGVKDGTIITGDATINYTLRVKDLSKVSILGTGTVTAKSLQTSDLTLNVAGAGTMNISGLKVEQLTSEASGSGNYTLEGTVDSQSLTINGAGNYNASDLKSRDAQLTINGAGNATVWADQQLDLNINGFGNVSYYGSPKVTQSIAGGGGVNALGVHP